MSNKKLFEKGYILKIVTWENDGDYYQTAYHHERDEKIAKKLAELFMLFSNEHRDKHKLSTRINNLYCPSEKELIFYETYVGTFLKNNIEIFKASFFKTHYASGFSKMQSLDFDELTEWMSDLFFDVGIHGTENMFTRVVESVEIMYFSKDVYYEEIPFN